MEIETTGSGFGPRGTAVLTISEKSDIPYDVGSVARPLAGSTIYKLGVKTKMHYDIYSGDDRKPMLVAQYEPRYKETDEPDLAFATAEELLEEFAQFKQIWDTWCFRALKIYRVNGMFRGETSRDNFRPRFEFDWERDAWDLRLTCSKWNLDEDKYRDYSVPSGEVNKHYHFTDEELDKFTQEDADKIQADLRAEAIFRIECTNIFKPVSGMVGEFNKAYKLEDKIAGWLDFDAKCVRILASHSNQSNLSFSDIESLRTVIAQISYNSLYELAKKWDILPKPKCVPTPTELKYKQEERVEKKKVASQKAALNTAWKELVSDLNSKKP